MHQIFVVTSFFVLLLVGCLVYDMGNYYMKMVRDVLVFKVRPLDCNCASEVQSLVILFILHFSIIHPFMHRFQIQSFRLRLQNQNFCMYFSFTVYVLVSLPICPSS
jgi:hypothetical protein